MNEDPKEKIFWAKQHAMFYKAGKMTKEEFKKHILESFYDEHNYYLKELISLGVIELEFKIK